MADFSGTFFRQICPKSILSPLMGIMVGSVFGELWKGKEFWILCQLDYLKMQQIVVLCRF
jgi:hypothetical protein